MTTKNASVAANACHRSLPAMALFLLVGGVALFAIPYHVAVAPSVSLSYVTGFNNRVAVLLLLVVCSGFAWFTGGAIGTQSEEDESLTGRSLAWAIVLVMFCCSARLFASKHHVPAGEAAYFLDRALLSKSGLRPYHGFEFPYGPLLVYSVVWVNRLLRGSLVPAYYVCWYSFWVVGTAMLWFTVRAVPFAVRTRRWIFWMLILLQIGSSIWNEGLQYTPVRFVCAALLIALQCAFVRRQRPLWMCCGTAAAAMVLALAVSPEQGVGTAIGLVAAAVFVWRAEKGRGRWAGIVAQAGCVLVLSAMAMRLRLFVDVVPFSRGAYALPLLPSPSVIAILLVYVAAACAGVLAYRGRLARSNVAPMVLGGAAMLPAALGRCDLGHLMVAAPAFLVGLGFLHAQRRFVAVVCAAETLCILLPCSLTQPIGLWNARHAAVATTAAAPAAPAAGAARFVKAGPAEGGLEKIESLDLPLQLRAPCERIYLTVTVPPLRDVPLQQQCLRPGYYRGLQDVITTSEVQGEIAWLRRAPGMPLLLLDEPLEAQFRPVEVNVDALHLLEASPWVPRVRNEAVTYDALIEAIQHDYVRTAHHGDGLRVRDPVSMPGEPK